MPRKRVEQRRGGGVEIGPERGRHDEDVGVRGARDVAKRGDDGMCEAGEIAPMHPQLGGNAHAQIAIARELCRDLRARVGCPQSRSSRSRKDVDAATDDDRGDRGTPRERSRGRATTRRRARSRCPRSRRGTGTPGSGCGGTTTLGVEKKRRTTTGNNHTIQPCVRRASSTIPSPARIAGTTPIDSTSCRAWTQDAAAFGPPSEVAPERPAYCSHLGPQIARAPRAAPAPSSGSRTGRRSVGSPGPRSSRVASCVRARTTARRAGAPR